MFHSVISLSKGFLSTSIIIFISNFSTVAQIPFATPQSNPFGLTNTYTQSNPTFQDLDNDGDFDILTGGFLGRFWYFENTGTSSAPGYTSYQLNPFGLVDIGLFASPTLADLDSDGDLDLLTGESGGNFKYFENTGTVSSPSFAPAVLNPFGLASINSNNSSPEFTDLDNDGDFDIICGDQQGDFYYILNAGTASIPVFSAAQLNPFGLAAINSNSNPTTLDIDNDGDQDLLIGEGLGNFVYYTNIGTASSPSFSLDPILMSNLTDIGSTSSPGIADLDGDGDLDVLSGSFSGGTLFYFENTSDKIHFVDKDNTSGNNDGSSWNNAFLDLQDAIEAAHDGDQIWVAEGTYFPSKDKNLLSNTGRYRTFAIMDDVSFYGGFAGWESNITERVIGSNETILDGDLEVLNDISDNSYHVVYSNHVNNVVFDGFIIQNGFIDETSPDYGGAGMFNDSSDIVINNCTLRLNTTYNKHGAGMLNFSGNPELHNTHFEFNQANGNDFWNARGGGLAHAGHMNALVYDCSFENNSTDWLGGGAFFGSAAPTQIYNCSFNKNSAGLQGGGANFKASHAAPWVFVSKVVNCSFEDNEAEDGGGLEIGQTALIIENTLFKGNIGTNGGGGLTFIGSYNTTSIDACIFESNISYVSGGGGIYARSGSIGKVSNSIFYDNQAISDGVTPIEGGGLLIDNVNTNFKITNCTIYKNEASGTPSFSDNGGGLACTNGATAPIANCIFWDNIAGVNEDIYFDGTPSPVNYTLSQIYSAGGTGNIVGQNPQFESTNVYGPNLVWPSDDDGLNLKASSPALNTGDNVAIIGSADIVGNQRIDGLQVDMGAYEVVLPLIINYISATEDCYQTGTATVDVSGGTQPYTYDWSNGGQNSTITNLAAGTYSVTITDANGFTIVDSIVVVASQYCSSVPCGNSYSKFNSYSLASNVIGALNYRFTFTPINGNVPSVIHIQTGNYIYFNTIPNLYYNTTYYWTVEVEYLPGVWGGLSDPICTITFEKPKSALPCGNSYSKFNSYTVASSVHAASKYRFTFTDSNNVAPTVIHEQAGNYIYFNTIPNLYYNTTYYWTVEVEYDVYIDSFTTSKAWGPASNSACTIIFEKPKSVLPCGNSYSKFNSYTVASSVHAASKYRFTFTDSNNVAPTVIHEQAGNYIYFNTIPNLYYNTTYYWTVEVEYDVYIDSFTTSKAWGPASDSACTIIFEKPKSVLPCGNSYSKFNSYTVASSVHAASKYRFTFTDSNNVAPTVIHEQTGNYIYFNTIPNLYYNTTYYWTVEVEYDVYIDSFTTSKAWGPASDSACTIIFEKPKSVLPCGNSYSKFNSYTVASSVHAASKYRFTFTLINGNSAPIVHEQLSNYIYFNTVPGLTNSTYYWTVEVEYDVYVDPVTTIKDWGPPSDPNCTISFINGSFKKGTSDVELREKEEEINMLVYPNPSLSDEISILITGKQKSSLRIYNTNGQLIYEGTNMQTNTELTFENLKSGTYFLRLQNKKQVIIKKLIVL